MNSDPPRKSMSIEEATVSNMWEIRKRLELGSDCTKQK